MKNIKKQKIHLSKCKNSKIYFILFFNNLLQLIIFIYKVFYYLTKKTYSG
jgi:hypothetical protein